MSTYYTKICEEFNSGDELMKAIVLNKAVIYYCLAQALVQHNESYKAVESDKGKNTADHLLADTLTVLRRQVKYNKLELRIQDGRVLVNKQTPDLFEYLSGLYSLVTDTSPVNPRYQENLEFEARLVNGQGFRKIYPLKESILAALHTFGCKDQQDKEDIFDESLLVFWKKLTQGEIGVYFSGNSQKLENCRVYNRKFYQNSKLSTFLNGISKNIFLNKTRTTGYQEFRNNNIELQGQEDLLPADTATETPALTLFLYYRHQVEERKLRTMVSILQYDCNLEDKEVRQLTGITNTRIHSSRLRAHFSEWYYRNIHHVPELLDVAHEYLLQRELKQKKLNEKIRVIDLHRRGSLNYLDIRVFKEEFRTIPEFRQYNCIFKYEFYFTTVGKPSALTGLPDEKRMRSLMELYKEGLYRLPNYQAILFLLFYGSDEPSTIILSLLATLKQELQQLSTPGEGSPELKRLLQQAFPADENELISELYKTNRELFDRFTTENDFVQMIEENEHAQGVF